MNRLRRQMLLNGRPSLINIKTIGVVSLLALSCAGCRLDNHTAAFLNDTTKAHPVQFASETETLFVELPSGREGLSRNQAADIRRFVERFKMESTNTLQVAAPSGSSGRFAVARSMQQVEAIIENAGIPSEAVHQNHYGSHGGRFGPAIRIAYKRPIAIPPECQDWSHDLAKNRERLPYRDFGCATQRNLALTVANARDLQHPQYETPRSSERRSTSWTQYVKGEGEKEKPLQIQ
jgi:pilus assembly protein CpaD